MRNRKKQSRPVLVRMIATSVIVCMLPLLLLSRYFFHLEENNLYAEQVTQMETVAEELANYWDNCMLAFDEIQIKHQTVMQFKDSVISQSAMSEREAIKFLKNLKDGYGFLYDSGIIRLGDEDSVYLSDAKYTLEYYAKLILGISEASLREASAEAEGPVYLPWNELMQLAICIFPERQQDGSSVRRYGLYVISRSSLENAVEPLTPYGCRIDRIESGNGEIIYRSSDSTSEKVWEGTADANSRVTVNGKVWYRTLKTTNRGFRIAVRMPETVILEKLRTWSFSVTTIIALIAFAGILVSVLSVLLNYRPIHKAVREVGSEELRNQTSNEIDLLVKAYHSQKSQARETEEQSENYRRMMLERIYKCLLGGRMLTNEEYELLHWQNQPYCIAVCDQVDSGILEDRQEKMFRQQNIRPVSMRMDRCMAFVIPARPGEWKERDESVRLILAILNNPQAALGVSRVYTQLGDFHSAYIESLLTVQHSPEGGICYAEYLPEHETEIFFETSFDTMMLINMIRAGDEKALETVRRIVSADRIEQEEKNLREYAFFRRLEYLRAAAQKAGVSLDEHTLAGISALSTYEQRQDAICALIEGILSERRNKLEIEKGILENEMLAYVEQNYRNSDFSLDLFAERFNMNTSVASREFKRVTGTNFKKYVTNRRLSLSRELLENTNLSTAAIAEQIGFSSDSYFVKVFRDAEGMTPAAYREQNHK